MRTILECDEGLLGLGSLSGVGTFIQLLAQNFQLGHRLERKEKLGMGNQITTQLQTIPNPPNQKVKYLPLGGGILL